jgi:hypothetical protein
MGGLADRECPAAAGTGSWKVIGAPQAGDIGFYELPAGYKSPGRLTRHNAPGGPYSPGRQLSGKHTEKFAAGPGDYAGPGERDQVETHSQNCCRGNRLCYLSSISLYASPFKFFCCPDMWLIPYLIMSVLKIAQNNGPGRLNNGGNRHRPGEVAPGTCSEMHHLEDFVEESDEEPNNRHDDDGRHNRNYQVDYGWDECDDGIDNRCNGCVDINLRAD